MFRCGHGSYGHGDALQCELLHDVIESASFLPHERSGGYAHIIKTYLSSVRSAPAQFVQLGGGDAGGVPVYDEHADARSLGIGVGLCGHNQKIAEHPVGDEGLAAVDDVMVAIALGRGTHGGHIAAPARLGDGKTPEDLARYALAQIVLLLRLRAFIVQVRQGQIDMRTDGRACSPRIDLGHLFHENDRVEEIEVETAILLSIGQPEETHVSELLIDVPWQFALLLPSIHKRDHLLLQKSTERLAEGIVVGGEVVRHGMVWKCAETVAKVKGSRGASGWAMQSCNGTSGKRPHRDSLYLPRRLSGMDLYPANGF